MRTIETVGSAINKPMKPKKYEKTSNDRISNAGCKPIFEPIILGARNEVSNKFNPINVKIVKGA